MCLILSLLLVVPNTLLGQDWVTANQSTIAWDAVTTLSNGDPVPENNTIGYAVYLANSITDPNKTNPAELGSILELSYLVTLNNEGSYFVGVKAIRKLSDGTIVGESNIAWSDNPEYTSGGNSFGIRYFLPPACVHNVNF